MNDVYMYHILCGAVICWCDKWLNFLWQNIYNTHEHYVHSTLTKLRMRRKIDTPTHILNIVTYMYLQIEQINRQTNECVCVCVCVCECVQVYRSDKGMVCLGSSARDEERAVLPENHL